MARPERFERPTPWFVATCSIQLSYGRLELAQCEPRNFVSDPATGAVLSGSDPQGSTAVSAPLYN